MLSFNEEFWIGISFVIFIYLAYKPLKNIILKILDQKILTIQQQVAESKKFNENMKLLVAETFNQIQNIETLREEMLSKGRDVTRLIVEKHMRATEELLENKKLNTLAVINRDNSKALQLRQEEFCNKIVALTALYLQTTKNEGMLDMEIAKKLMKNELSTSFSNISSNI